MSTKGFVHLMRSVLRGTTEPMTLDQIIEESGDEIARVAASAVVGQRVRAGELIRHNNEHGVLTYSMNPAYVDGRGRSAGSRKAAKEPKKSPAKSAAKKVAGPKAKPAPAPVVSPLPPTPIPVKKALPSFFAERLDGICADLEAAIGDACDAQASHELIKQLVNAQGATQRALHSTRKVEAVS